MKETLIENFINKVMLRKYKNGVKDCLKALRDRLEILKSKIDAKPDEWNDSSNFFFIKKDGRLLQANERAKLVPKLSNILLKIFVQALKIEGTLELGNFTKKIKISAN